MSPEQFMFIAGMWSAILFLIILFTSASAILITYLVILVRDLLKKHKRNIQ